VRRAPIPSIAAEHALFVRGRGDSAIQHHSKTLVARLRICRHHRRATAFGNRCQNRPFGSLPLIAQHRKYRGHRRWSGSCHERSRRPKEKPPEGGSRKTIGCKRTQHCEMPQIGCSNFCCALPRWRFREYNAPVINSDGSFTIARFVGVHVQMRQTSRS
jgi:hypothetical protein